MLRTKSWWLEDCWLIKYRSSESFRARLEVWNWRSQCMPAPQSRLLGRLLTVNWKVRNSVKLLSIKQRLKFPHFGSANKDSLRRASKHTFKSLRSNSDYLGHNTRKQAWVNFKGFWPAVLRLSLKRPSVFERFLSISRLMQKLSFISLHWNFSENAPRTIKTGRPWLPE